MNTVVLSLLGLAVPVVGWVAAVVVLSAYALQTSGRIAADSITYLGANAVGSAGLAVSTIAAHAWQSAAVNVLWLAFGAAPLLRLVRDRRLLRAAARTLDAERATAGSDVAVG